VSEPDGTLHDWRDIEKEHEWDTLLLGNGLSINVWEPFKYRELYDHARGGAVLTDADRRLFAETPNFERVLGEILTAIRVDECVGVDSAPLYRCYQSIQLALGHAVRAVHVNRDRVPLATRKKIRTEMAKFEWVFTTSYDLLVYWSMACDGKFEPFVDLFMAGSRLEFDVERTRVRAGSVPVYFLHGALHLVVGGSGTTWKLRQTLLDTLLDQFGEPIAGDPQARPLLVTEGSAADKLDAIEDNAYLSHALKQLSERDLPIVVFGSGLGSQDSHITDALNENPDRAVAISMLPGPKKDLLPRQGEIFGRLEASPLIFFDARTHPLGDQGLNVPVVTPREV
jgi:hypothetical protein